MIAEEGPAGYCGNRITKHDTVTYVTGIPCVGVVVFCNVWRQIDNFGVGLAGVDTHIPPQSVPHPEDVTVNMAFPAPSIKRTYVHVVEHESGTVAETESFDYLIIAVCPEICEVCIDPVVQEAAFKTYLL